MHALLASLKLFSPFLFNLCRRSRCQSCSGCRGATDEEHWRPLDSGGLLHLTGSADSVHPARPFGLRNSGCLAAAGWPCSPLSLVSSLSHPSSSRAPALVPMGARKLLLVVDPEVCKAWGWLGRGAGGTGPGWRGFGAADGGAMQARR